jgi:hypothetical protein
MWAAVTSNGVISDSSNMFDYFKDSFNVHGVNISEVKDKVLQQKCARIRSTTDLVNKLILDLFLFRGSRFWATNTTPRESTRFALKESYLQRRTPRSKFCPFR